MRRNTKMIILFIAMCGIGGAGYLGILFGPVVLTGVRGMRVREQLLCRTDHKALLAACQELSDRVAAGKLEDNVYRFGFWPDAEVSQFPEAIRALKPRFVTISRDGTIRIELNDKWWSLGIRACPAGYEKRFPGYSFGDRKLLDEFWYYDDNYLHDPNYDREIDAIVAKRSPRMSPAAPDSSPADQPPVTGN